MKKKILAIIVLSITLLGNGIASTASAQGQVKKSSSSAHSTESMNMGGDMKGMMDMKGSCSRMMQGGMMGHMFPQFPAGNEKLQLQMHAEIMQKIGEIEAKYVNLIKEDRK